MHKLSRLNELLRDKNLKLPDHRREVQDSGANFEWLKKHIAVKNKDVPQELLDILNSPFGSLIK